MSWIGSIYDCCLCMTFTWSDLNPPCLILYGRRAVCRWWSVHTCCDKQEVFSVRCRASLNLSRLCYGCQRCTLSVAQQCHSARKYMRTFNFREIVKRPFKIYGIWPQAQSVSCIHTHLCNAVPLVWGSLRLAPINNLPWSINFQSSVYGAIWKWEQVLQSYHSKRQYETF